ncbi:MAG TPA: flagellar hook-associated protein FlgK, partial [Planctomycetota bacterium]|nr:flagellar hook-associated protein FlgK [Planctomycetota bacterium]
FIIPRSAPKMSLAMSTALSALMASQRMAEVTSHNIANANTPGYSRQVAVLKPSLPVQTTAGVMGTGVTIERILAIRDDFLNSRIASQKTNLGKTEVQNKTLAGLESVILPSPDSGLGNAIDDFFRSINELANNPQSDVSRESVRQSALTLSTTFHSVNGQLRQLQTDARNEFDDTIDQANSYVQQIADLNMRIMSLSGLTDTANDLIDERTLRIEQLSQLIDIQTTQERGMTGVLFEGRLIVSGTDSLSFASDSSGGRLKLKVSGTDDTFETASGTIGGLSELYNSTIPQYIGYIDEIARGLIGEFNAVHTTGVGVQNGYATLVSSAELADLDLNGIAGDELLASQALPFPPAAGTLYITVTNTTTGEMTRRAIDYDPAVDSVQSLAGKIAGVPYVNASVTSGFLTITAWPGYRFDFSNKLLPDGGQLGTSQLTVSGAYEGSDDRGYTFYPINSGTVGQTEDLRVAVMDSKGRSLGLVQVGSTYTPGAPIPIADGISVAFGAGDLQAAVLQAAAGPFALADGDELTFSVDGGPDATVTLNAADFADISQATVYELADVVNAAGAGVTATVVDGTLRISSDHLTPGSTISAGGSAAAKLGLPAGTIANDSQSINGLGQTDTGGLLRALGINSFFQGDGAGNITLSEHILSNLGNIAAAKTSPPGDNANAVLLARIKNSRIMSGNTQTLNDFFAAVVGRAGIVAEQASRGMETQTKLVENLEQQRMSISGVSLEEEMARLMQTQQAYYAAIRLLTSIDEMLQSLTEL